MSRKTIKVVDPTGCRCTDCLVGDSIPLDWLSVDDKDWIAQQNDFVDRTGLDELGWDVALDPDLD
jgi:hypothetical protein